MSRFKRTIEGIFEGVGKGGKGEPSIEEPLDTTEEKLNVLETKTRELLKLSPKEMEEKANKLIDDIARRQAEQIDHIDVAAIQEILAKFNEQGITGEQLIRAKEQLEELLKSSGQAGNKKN